MSFSVSLQTILCVFGFKSENNIEFIVYVTPHCRTKAKGEYKALPELLVPSYIMIAEVMKKKGLGSAGM